MFANFLYFIVALLLYTTCQFPQDSAKPADHSLMLFFLMVLFFTAVCRFVFQQVGRQSERISIFRLEQQVEKAILRLSILALLIFALTLYGLRLKLFFSDFFLFQIFPTFEAFFFLAIFVGYLVIVWNYAWEVQKRFFLNISSKKTFVVSNISFSLPALLPWFALSLTADMIQLLPFTGLKEFMASPGGEICYVLLFLFAVAVFGPFLIQKLWRCTSLERGIARERIEDICSRAGVRYADIVRWELFGGTMITAGVMGIVAKFRYILVTPALLRMLSLDEIDAVIAHELGHVQKKHMFFYLFFFAGYIVSVYALFEPLAFLVFYSALFLNFFSFLHISPDFAQPIMFSFILILLFIVYFRYVFGFFMRNCERQADLHVFTLIGSARSLIATFNKIAGFGRQSRDKPCWHHFSIQQRMDFLEKCEDDPSLIEKHNKKIRHMLIGYAGFIVMICIFGYAVNFGEAGKHLDSFMAEKILLHQLQVQPENSQLYTLVGDYYYNAGSFEKAVQAYENVLKIDGNNVNALNNLAWLFATCSKTSLQDHKRALVLAEKAVRLSQEPHILDTYAEACFLNGHYSEAVHAAEQALEKAESRKEYYESQLNRFQSKD
ncbi:MAG: M48 family metalloprotease [Thermodesulfobacteriota bacterium]|nr:M48 family metalloprotease [Thermodesulfobacteriota bacterium]